MATKNKVGSRVNLSEVTLGSLEHGLGDQIFDSGAKLAPKIKVGPEAQQEQSWVCICVGPTATKVWTPPAKVMGKLVELSHFASSGLAQNTLLIDWCHEYRAYAHIFPYITKTQPFSCQGKVVLLSVLGTYWKQKHERAWQGMQFEVPT